MAVGLAGGGLYSSDRLEGYWTGRLGQARANWARRGRTGPRRGSGWAEATGKLGLGGS
ncbi:hypothetical protein CRG98_005363 [Punica granatum]|uniref:Uncharacterized protein n=1 Tax=Punica granatum TaxID=22663 RepID=A0A2I0L0L9_PUNGR|nr:hypothetical protein CRG98_005363 [Punica granatum]